MELHNGKLLWSIADHDIEIKSRTIKDHYDVLIVGGGISGSLCAYTLANEQLRVAVIDKGKMGTGSTMASTGLLHYTNDIMLHDLITQIGAAKAVRFYRMCQEAIEQLDAIAAILPVSSEFSRRKTFYYASEEPDVHRLKKEYETLKHYGFAAELWKKDDIEDHFPFSKPAAIVTNRDAEMNPVKFNRGLLHFLDNIGVDLFEHIHIKHFNETPSGFDIQTSIGRFHADHVVVATGYEKPPFISGTGANLNCTYAMATERIKDLTAWKDRILIWETKRPYLYLRTTVDGRIIAGGLDEKIPLTPVCDDWIKNRAQVLKQEVNKLFPMLDIRIAFSWGAIFGESPDSLPFIGRHPARNKIYYLLGYGGNGTVYSMLGSVILRDLILGRPNFDAEIVKLDR